MLRLFINLDRAPERRAHMEAQAEALGLAFERLPATDGLEFTEAEAARYRSGPGRNATLTRLELALAQSHRAAWARLLDSQHSHAAIFEDDVAFGEQAQHWLKDASWIPEGADIVKLETWGSRVRLGAAPADGFAQSRALDRTLRPLLGLHLGAGAYILNRGAAQRLHAGSERICEPLDVLLFDEAACPVPALRREQLHPAVCIQQRRSDEDFLCANAARSSLDELEAARRPGPGSKLWRELKRPFRQLRGAWAKRKQPRGEVVPFR